MLYPGNIEQKIGFDQIRKLLERNCQSLGGHNHVARMQFSDDHEKVSFRLGQTDEMLSLINEGLVINLPSLEARTSLDDIRIEGTYLEGEVLLEIADALKMADLLSKKITDEYPGIHSLADMVRFAERLPHAILDKFDGKGELKDSASPQLHKLRSDQKKASQGVRSSLKKIFQKAKLDGIIPENSQPTFRDGRFVIPVIAAHKRSIQGFIHDESSTGQTVYLEPSEVLETNNKIVELQHQEKRECIRIFTEISQQIRNELDAVDDAFKYLGVVDFVHAKCMLAQKLEAIVPEVINEPMVELTNARHPLLYINYLKESRNVVPLTISLKAEAGILLISGPNAGGKSVCLKTVGLFQYMFQCGLLIPAAPDSKMGLFQSMFVDIGDEQSLENDLSTYSSHLTNMRVMLAESGPKSLLLIDEFGTGTDPAFGGAIAEAILEKFVKKQVFGVITTHYGNLKEWAQSHEGIRNAAMQFDAKKLEPLYRLELDRPGSSFALEIADKIGLPNAVVARAKDIVGTDTVEVETLINKLSNEKNELERKLKTVHEQEQKLKQALQKYESLQANLEDKKQVIIQKARTEAQQLLDRTNKQIEKTIRHIKENKAQKGETQKIRKQLNTFKSDVEVEQSTGVSGQEPMQFIPGKIDVGDYVWNEKSQISGEVIGIQGKKVKMAVGELLTHTNLDVLQKIRKPVFKKSSSAKPSINLTQKQSMFSSQLDVRGLRAEEVHSKLERFLDDALLLGCHEISVLHGKGDGILRKVVRNYVKSVQHVAQVADEHIERGGSGISVITLE